VTDSEILQVIRRLEPFRWFCLGYVSAAVGLLVLGILGQVPVLIAAYFLYLGVALVLILGFTPYVVRAIRRRSAPHGT
jgi:hypothetical protein